MDYHLDRKPQYVSASEVGGRGAWAIKEVDDEGDTTGREFIPWRWTSNFIASEIDLVEDFELRPRFGAADEERPRCTRLINVRLKPGRLNSLVAYNDTAYSMFGSDRFIDDIRLEIQPKDDVPDDEVCLSWGGVSYTAETDFRYYTMPDCLMFYLYVEQSAFDRYASLIAQKGVSQATFSVSRVEGFYSEWSPGISTPLIKVLTESKEHALELPEGTERIPPRLGKVGEATLRIMSRTILATGPASNAPVSENE